MAELKKTPLNESHRKRGAKMVDFGGWDMPVQYSGIKDEHQAVRTKAGLFDVSHMGELRVRGEGALALLQKVVTSDISTLVPGQIKYGVLCLPNGGVVDDLLVYKLEENDYLLVVNASNIEKDYAWIKENHRDEKAEVINESDSYGQVALQGPLALGILQKLTDTDLESVDYYHFVTGQVAGVEGIISRTGYTGEDGFEFYCSANDVPAVWDAIFEAGGDDVMPCGLGARDTLRFEAKMPLYGHEMTEEITPLETGLGRFVALEKGDFIGRDVLARQKEEGRPRKVVGLEMVGRGIARAGYPVIKDGEEIGTITTGSYSPTFDKNLALAIVGTKQAAVDDTVHVVIRNKEVEAKVVKTPFYRRG